MPAWLALAAFAVLSLPGLAALLPDGHPCLNGQLIVLAWTLVAAVGCGVTGGPGSPLSILFVLGPFTALALGHRRLTLEAIGFSGLAYLALWAMNAFGLLALPAENVQGLATAVAFAAILQAGVLCAVSLVAQGRRSDWAPSGEIAASQTGQTLDLRGGVKLPSTLPVVAISVTPQGRIRSVEGDTSLVGSYKLGELETDLLDRISTGLANRLTGKGAARLRYPSGLLVQWHRRAGRQGAGLVAFPLAASVSAASSPDVGQGERKAVRERTAFFASLGHDLKTPLNAIIGFSDMMKSGIRGPMPEAYQDYAEIIHESGEDLLLLVEDMLDLAKADADSLKLDLQPVDLAASGHSVMRQLGAAAERADVTLELNQEEGECLANADPRAVRQIWQNLVSNAIKYSEPGGLVQLQVIRREAWAVLAVEDRGAGMDEEDLMRLAEPFAQGKNAAGRKGTGLGLAVVKQFADLHGGQVKVETSPGEGTRIEVAFPAASPISAPPFEEAAQ